MQGRPPFLRKESKTSDDPRRRSKADETQEGRSSPPIMAQDSAPSTNTTMGQPEEYDKAAWNKTSRIKLHMPQSRMWLMLSAGWRKARCACCPRT